MKPPETRVKNNPVPKRTNRPNPKSVSFFSLTHPVGDFGEVGPRGIMKPGSVNFSVTVFLTDNER